MNQQQEEHQPTTKCHHCDHAAIIRRGEIYLCVDCYHKVAQADFMEQQLIHNQLAWTTSNLNFLEQQLYIGHGGLLPLKQAIIPQPPTAPMYSYNQIKVSDSVVGVINSGTLFNLDTSIDVMQNRGEKDLACAIKQLTQAVIDSKEINDTLRREVAEQLEFLVTESLASEDKQRKGLARKVIDNVSQSISTVASLMTIWNTLQPLLQRSFGLP